MLRLETGLEISTVVKHSESLGACMSEYKHETEVVDSSVRTPIFPVKKIRDGGQPTEWRFVQDLQAVNAAVRRRAPLVPNPYTILSQIPQDATFFSVVDLANAFFSVPVDKNSQFWFAFEFDGKGYTFTRMGQGYCDSPTLYNENLSTS